MDVVVTYPKLILSLDGDSQRIPTKENQFIIVDTTSRWRISDPAQFYQSFKTLEAANIRLSDIIDSATRTIITQNKLSEVVRSSNLINEKTENVEKLESTQKYTLLNPPFTLEEDKRLGERVTYEYDLSESDVFKTWDIALAGIGYIHLTGAQYKIRVTVPKCVLVTIVPELL